MEFSNYLMSKYVIKNSHFEEFIDFLITVIQRTDFAIKGILEYVLMTKLMCLKRKLKMAAGI